MRCLWIAREIPFPANSGDRIYTAQLARAFGQANGGVTFVGIADGATAPAPQDDQEVRWMSIGGGRHGLLRSLLSSAPLVAAMHATPAYKAKLDSLFSEEWDVIVFDHYGSGWALQRYLNSPFGRSKRRARTVYIAHNHEERVLRAVATDSDASPVKRLGFWQNYLKTRAMERYMVRHVDLVSAITEEDAAAFRAQQPGVATLVLTPGYNGAVCQQRQISAETPRHVLMVGSFQWAAKQENLRQFLRIADPVFAQNNIVFDVVGSMPDGLRAELTPSLTATRLHGFVDDPTSLFDGARMALVPEAIGGGFKLKFLDYLFRRLPVATLRDAAAGLPGVLRSQMIEAESLVQLVERIVEQVGDAERLNALQDKAYIAAGSLFKWYDRGLQLRAALESPS